MIGSLDLYVALTGLILTGRQSTQGLRPGLVYSALSGLKLMQALLYLSFPGSAWERENIKILDDDFMKMLDM